MIKKLLFIAILSISALAYSQDFPDIEDQYQWKSYVLSGPLDRTSPYTALEPGSVKELYNMQRPAHGIPMGWKTRSGTTRHNTTAISGNTVESLHSYYSKQHSIRTFLAQCNNNIYLADNVPPDSGATFGSSIYTLQTGTSPAFSDTVGDDWVGAASGTTPFAWSGTTSYPDSFIINRTSGTTHYHTGWDTVRNNDDTSWMRFIQDTSDVLYVGYHRRLDGIYLDFVSGATNVESSGITISAWRNGAWTQVSGTADGTATGTTPFWQSGLISWTYSVSDDPYLLDGTIEHKYWYRLEVDDDITNGIKLWRARVTSDCEAVTNLWSGIWDLAIGCTLSNTTGYQNVVEDVTDGSPYSYVNLSGLTTMYVGFAKPAFSILLQVDPDNKNSSVTTVPTINYWSGASDSWTTVGTVADGTSTSGKSLDHSGYIQWDGDFTEGARQFDGSGIEMYWYQIVWSNAFTDSVYVWEIAQAEKPSILDKYAGVANYNGRAVYWPGEYFKSGLDFSPEGKHWVLNGIDAGSTGDIFGYGTVNAFTQFTASVGILSTKDPYRLYLLEGKVPGNFDELLISTHVGVVAPHTLVVVEDAVRLFNTNRTVHTAFFMAPDGFYLTDGQTVIKISQPIEDYWDLTSAPYIEPSYAHLSYSWIDYENYTVMTAVPINTSGSGTQHTNNYVLVYNYITGEWYDRFRYTEDIACGTTLVGSDDNYYSYIGDYSGTAYKLNAESDDWDNNIRNYLITSDIPLVDLNYSAMLTKMAVKAKTQTSGVMDITIYPDGHTNGLAPSGITTISMIRSGYDYIGQSSSAINLGGREMESLAIQIESGATTNDIMEIYGFTLGYQPITEAWE